MLKMMSTIQYYGNFSIIPHISINFKKMLNISNVNFNYDNNQNINEMCFSFNTNNEFCHDIIVIDSNKHQSNEILTNPLILQNYRVSLDSNYSICFVLSSQSIGSNFIELVGLCNDELYGHQSNNYTDDIIHTLPLTLPTYIYFESVPNCNTFQNARDFVLDSYHESIKCGDFNMTDSTTANTPSMNTLVLPTVESPYTYFQQDLDHINDQNRITVEKSRKTDNSDSNHIHAVQLIDMESESVVHIAFVAGGPFDGQKQIMMSPWKHFATAINNDNNNTTATTITTTNDNDKTTITTTTTNNNNNDNTTTTYLDTDHISETNLSSFADTIMNKHNHKSSMIKFTLIWMCDGGVNVEGKCESMDSTVHYLLDVNPHVHVVFIQPIRISTLAFSERPEDGSPTLMELIAAEGSSAVTAERLQEYVIERIRLVDRDVSQVTPSWAQAYWRLYLSFLSPLADRWVDVVVVGNTGAVADIVIPEAIHAYAVTAARCSSNDNISSSDGSSSINDSNGSNSNNNTANRSSDSSSSSSSSNTSRSRSGITATTDRATIVLDIAASLAQPHSMLEYDAVIAPSRYAYTAFAEILRLSPSTTTTTTSSTSTTTASSAATTKTTTTTADDDDDDDRRNIHRSNRYSNYTSTNNNSSNRSSADLTWFICQPGVDLDTLNHRRSDNDDDDNDDDNYSNNNNENDDNINNNNNNNNNDSTTTTATTTASTTTHPTTTISTTASTATASNIVTVGFVGRLVPMKSPAVVLLVAQYIKQQQQQQLLASQLLVNQFSKNNNDTLCSATAIDSNINNSYNSSSNNNSNNNNNNHKSSSSNGNKNTSHPITPIIDIRFRIIGGGTPAYEASLQRLAVHLDVQDIVEFVGKTSQTDLPHHLHQLDILLNPSVSANETFCVVNLEAMAAGLAVVSYGTYGQGEYLIGWDDGDDDDDDDEVMKRRRRRRNSCNSNINITIHDDDDDDDEWNGNNCNDNVSNSNHHSNNSSNSMLASLPSTQALAEAVLELAYNHTLRTILGINGQKLVHDQFTSIQAASRYVSAIRQAHELRVRRN